MSLKSRAVSGARWAIGARLLRTGLGIVTTGVLARFLAPADFGVMALIGFVTGIVMVLGDFGTRVALVQRKEVTAIQQDSVFWSNVAIALVTVGVIQLAAGPIAAALGDPGATGPLRWVSLTFLLTAIQGVPLSALERRFAFRQIALTELATAVLSAAAAVGFAVAGYGVAALVAQALAGSLAYTMLIVLMARWRPRLRFSREALAPLLGYGSYVTATGLVQAVAWRLDRPVIGHRLSPADLGYLAMAQQVISSPMQVVVQMVRRVTFPVMASVQDDDARLRRGYLLAQHGLMVVMAPVALGLWALAEPVVAVLLGPGWEVVAVLMGFTTVGMLLQSVSNFNASLFAAKGQARFQFRWSLLSTAISLLVLFLTVPYGLVALVAARLASSVVLTAVNAAFAIRLIGQPAGELLGVLARPALSALVMAAAVTALRPHLPEAAALQLALGVPFGAAVYVALELLIDRRRALPLLRQVLGR